jgi:hypothetical protein
MANDDGFLHVDFGSGGAADGLCVAGWSAPEPGERWTVGPASRIALPAPALPGQYALVLRLRPFVAGTGLPAQRLRLSANGQRVAEFTIAKRGVRGCVLPWHLLEGRPSLLLDLELPDAARPSDFGACDDARQLGVAMTGLLLYRDVHAAALPEAALLADERVEVDADAVARVEGMAHSGLLMHFESLGQNCEFGLVQRACGAEPLSLLRFSSTPLPELLAALDARFEGMGAPEHTRVELSPSGREYMVHDSRFGFTYHAWVEAGAAAPEEIAAREARRVPFLVRKLVEDLSQGEKIFVFRGMGALREEEAFPLALAIRRYGPAALLLVTLSDPEHPGGTVALRAPGLMVGSIDRFAPGDRADDFLLDQWVGMCREALRLRLAALSVVAPQDTSQARTRPA